MDAPKVVVTIHNVRKHILQVLSYAKWARFRDMKPKNVDSNLYNYHLKALTKEGYVEHVEGKGYRLSPMGLRYVDHLSSNGFNPRWQPKIINMLYVENPNGLVLLWQKHRQPFVGAWTLPNGKMHYEDHSIMEGASREASYFLAGCKIDLQFAGVAEIYAKISQELVSHVVANIFRAYPERIPDTMGDMIWVDIEKENSLKYAPATKQIIHDTKNYTDFGYRHYDIDW